MEDWAEDYMKGDIMENSIYFNYMTGSYNNIIKACQAYNNRNAAINKANNKNGANFANCISNMANSQPHTSIVYMKTDDMLYSGGNGTGLSFYIKYAPDSTQDDPTVVAKGVDENGNEFEKTIHINDINMNNASIVEMRALEAHIGVDKNGGLTSLPPETGNMGLNERRNFTAMFRKQISDMRLLNQRRAVDYYQYSMQKYCDFFLRT